MYIDFLVVQSTPKNKRGDGKAPQWSPESCEMIPILAKLAFEQLQKGNVIFYESDLRDCGITVRSADAYSGVFTQMFRRERGLFKEEVFCFVHLSVQEFLAALHAHLTFTNFGTNILSEKKTLLRYLGSKLPNTKIKQADFYQCAALLRGLINGEGSSEPNQEIIGYIKEKIGENLSSERIINLFHCLNELNDSSLVQEWSALGFMLLSSGQDLEMFDLKKYSASEWVLLRLLPVVRACRKAMCLQVSSGVLQVFCRCLQVCLQVSAGVYRCLQVVCRCLQVSAGVLQVSAGVLQVFCRCLQVFCKCSPGVFRCLQVFCRCLQVSAGVSAGVCRCLQVFCRCLQVFCRCLQVSGVLQVSAGVLQVSAGVLQVSHCNLRERSCEALSPVLSASSSSLLELDLSNNDLRDSGLNELSVGLKSPNCRLKILSSLVQEVQQNLRSRRLTTESLSSAQWSALGFILLSSGQDLEMFDLKKYSASERVLLRLLPVVTACRKAMCLQVFCRCLQVSAVVLCLQVSAGVLQVSVGVLLVFCRCLQVSAGVCRCLQVFCRCLQVSAGVLQVSAGVCRREPEGFPAFFFYSFFRLSHCNLRERSCKALSPVLSSSSSSLLELDLRDNDLRDSGLNKLFVGLKSPNCRLEILRLSGCLIKAEGCSSLASALRSNPTHLKELDLSFNHPGDVGTKQLSAVLEDPELSLEVLRLDHCGKERLKSGLKKYHCELSVDTNTVHRSIQLSNNRVMRTVAEDQPYPDHPERFEDCPQLLCSNSLTGRCYWEVEWTGFVCISVAYKKIRRHGSSPQSRFGRNQQSWSLVCSDRGYFVLHDDKSVALPFSSTGPRRVAVYVNYPAGTVTFYRITTDTLVHLHTFKTTFTEPLFPGFGFSLWSWFVPGSSVRLCSNAGEASV
ncbi:Neoverrucotoxin subunit beta [Takifugu flavidus]|uniref:Neoverrucotoxin subunit beta n=1 Tax=Takifugu flavidus TaxID=433684 RepID=A0A5C6MXS8_9TELE|nr:Neoverrucotoxin subunit beta [Takifugu flavidus]